MQEYLTSSLCQDDILLDCDRLIGLRIELHFELSIDRFLPAMHYDQSRKM